MLEESVINIEVIFAGVPYQICTLQVPIGTTIEQAIQHSGILQIFPLINLHPHPTEPYHLVGIYGTIKPLHEKVQANDRIEIYQPLLQTAIAARKARIKAQHAKQRLQVKDLV
jgi:uncharacterized protein